MVKLRKASYFFRIDQNGFVESAWVGKPSFGSLSPEEWRSRNIIDLVPQSTRDTFCEALKSTLTDGLAASFFSSLRLGDSHEHYEFVFTPATDSTLLLNLIPQDRDSAEEHKHTASDCPHCNLLKEELAKVKQESSVLEIVYNLLPVGLGVLDKDMRYIKVNRALADINGIGPDDHRGKTLYDLVPAYASELERTYRNVMESGAASCALPFRGPKPNDTSGEIFNWRVDVYPLEGDGEFRGVGCLVKNVTEVVRPLEDQLIRAERIGKMGSWEWHLDEDSWNGTPELFRILGLPSSEQLSLESLLNAAHPEDRERLRQSINRCREQEETFELEYRLQDRNGKSIWVIAHGGRTTDTNEKANVLHGIVQNITEQKEAQQRERKFMKKTRQTQTLETVGRFAGGIAHDFNNILGTILGFAQMTQKGTLNSQCSSHVREIVMAARRGKDLVQKLLSFCNQQPRNTQPVNLTQLVAESLELVQAIQLPSIDIRSKLSNEELLVMADPSEVHQIVMNLMKNAIDSMESGVIEVTLEQVPQIPDGDTNLNDEKRALLTIRDSGCGISEEHKSRIFEPFFTTKEVGKGTGMGLAVVYGIVEALHGHIRIQSQADKGTSVSIWLPLICKEDLDSIELRNLFRGNGRRVLLVDDEAGMLKLGSLHLSELGFRVETASSAFQALERIHDVHSQYDAVITDFRMPRMDGVQLAKIINRFSTALPVILATAYHNEISEQELDDLNVSQILVKPFSTEQLATVLGQYFN